MMPVMHDCCSHHDLHVTSVLQPRQPVRFSQRRPIECNQLTDFYQRVSIASYASAGIARAEMSVRLSDRPSHSGIVSKRRKLAS